MKSPYTVDTLTARGPRLLTVREVAQLLSISRGHAYNLVARGDLPAIKVGPNGPLRIDSDDLADFLAEANR